MARGRDTRVPCLPIATAQSGKHLLGVRHHVPLSRISPDTLAMSYAARRRPLTPARDGLLLIADACHVPLTKTQRCRTSVRALALQIERALHRVGVDTAHDEDAKVFGLVACAPCPRCRDSYRSYCSPCQPVL